MAMTYEEELKAKADELKAKDPTLSADEAFIQAASLVRRSEAPPVRPTLSADAAKELQAGQAKAMRTNAGISAGLQAGQMVLAALPTVQDTRNKEQLAKLQRMEKEGRLGLSGEERQFMEQQLLAPVQAQTRESRLRQEAAQASAGTSTSAAAQVRAQREATRTNAAAAQRAGLAITQANFQRAREQLQELEERAAYKSERQKGMRQQAAQTLSGMGGVLGQVRAAKAVEGLSPEAYAAYRNAGLDDDDIALIAQAHRKKQLGEGYAGQATVGG